MQVYEMVYRSQKGKIKQHLGVENEEARHPSFHPSSQASHTRPTNSLLMQILFYMAVFVSTPPPLHPFPITTLPIGAPCFSRRLKAAFMLRTQ